MRVAILSSILALCAAILPVSAQALPQSYRLNIPREPLDGALKDLAQQTGLQIARFSDTPGGSALVGPLSGDMPVGQALTSLLETSGLTYKMVNDHTVAVVAAGGKSPTTDTASNSQTTQASQSRSGETQKEGGRKSSGTFLLAQATSGQVANSASVEAQQRQASGVPIQEVIVTAQKREERLQDVPMSLTALTGEQLARTQSYRFEDYAGMIPGLTLIDDGALGSQLVLRGITTGVNAVNSSVATYIDETPYTAEGPFANSIRIAPNLDTFDMQRIEVLRGPQGTLYGSNALAGLLKYVTNAPDPSGFSATTEAGASTVYNGGTGFDVHGMVNLPLSDNAALRIVGYDNYYPGFIDDPSRGVSDINGTHFTGGRLSLLYKPVDAVSIRFNALYQEKSWGDNSNEDVNPGTLTPVYGNLIQENLIGQPGTTQTQLYNLTVQADLGVADLLSTTSYADYQWHGFADFKELAPIVSSILGAPYGVALKYSTPVESVTQEFRLSSKGSQTLDWQLGAFFTHEHINEFEGNYPIDVTSKAILVNYPTNVGAFYIPATYREFAEFANLDYHFTPTFDVGLGGRYSSNDQTFHETGLGIFGGGANFDQASSQGVFTFSSDARWHFTSDNMLYARIAEGFVPGGPNDAIPGSNLPHSYSSSTTMNYEAGIKSELLDDRFTVDVSAFDIQWQKIQVEAVVGGLATITNGGTARSAGAEWNFAYVPVRGLTLDLNGAYTHAYLTEATPASVGGQAGDRLPAVPLWQSSLSADYTWPVFGQCSGFAGVNWRFSGSRYADFEASTPRQEMPSYGILDLRGGIEGRDWSAALYVKNVGNKIAINYVQPETLQAGLGPQSAVIATPRTIGLTATVSF